MWTLAFWKATAERGVKTGAQFVLTVLGVAAISSGVETPQGEALNAFAWDYLTLGGAFAAGVLISGLTSLVTAKVTDGNPSAINAEVITDGTGEHRA